MAIKPNGQILSIKEQIIDDACGLTLMFTPRDGGGFLLCIEGEGLPTGGRDFLFNEAGELELIREAEDEIPPAKEGAWEWADVVKPDAKMLAIKEQVIEDEESGLEMVFVVKSDDSSCPFRLYLYGDALKFGNRELLFEKGGELGATGTGVGGFCKARWIQAVAEPAAKEPAVLEPEVPASSIKEHILNNPNTSHGLMFSALPAGGYFLRIGGEKLPTGSRDLVFNDEGDFETAKPASGEIPSVEDGVEDWEVIPPNAKILPIKEQNIKDPDSGLELDFSNPKGWVRVRISGGPTEFGVRDLLYGKNGRIKATGQRAADMISHLQWVV